MGVPNDKRQPHPFEQTTEKQPVILKDNAFNPKVPVAALGASQLGELVQWVASGVGVDMPTTIAYTVGGIIMLVVAYFLPGRAN